MKKQSISFFIVVLLILSLTVPAIAASRAVDAHPTLTIKNGVAYCQGKCDSGNPTDRISLVLTLKEGASVIDTWTANGTEYVSISENCPVKSGRTYTLILTAKINGIPLKSRSVSENS